MTCRHPNLSTVDSLSWDFRFSLFFFLFILQIFAFRARLSHLTLSSSYAPSTSKKKNCLHSTFNLFILRIRATINARTPDLIASFRILVCFSVCVVWITELHRSQGPLDKNTQNAEEQAPPFRLLGPARQRQGHAGRSSEEEPHRVPSLHR